MDWLDFVFKFSSELVLLALAAMVAITNFYFLGGSSAKAGFVDQSLAANFLNNHTALNSRLAAQNNSIVVSVANNGFFPFQQAQAEDFVGLSADSQQTDPSATDNSGVAMADDNSSFVQPNPDSVSALVAKQIKIYETQAGDTLKSIAQENGISQQTIMWANNLSSPTIKPGWQLIILPTDGILVTADPNDTLPDLAYRYSPERYNSNKTVRDDAANQLLDKIISYNLLDGPEDINPGDIIIVPGGVIAEPPAPPKPQPTPRPPHSTLAPGQEYIPPQGNGSVGHFFPWGQCTWYVAKVLHDEYNYDVPWGGNARNWSTNAKAYGAVVNREPAAGTIVVTNESRFGHVAIVKEVTDTSIVVTEMNYKGKGIVDTRSIPLNSSVIKAFIYR